MTRNIHFDGIIKNVRYEPQLSENLEGCEIANLNVNVASLHGVVKLPHDHIAYSIWDSPIQINNLSFAGIYNAYGYARRQMVIIPIMKDTGVDRPIEYIQYSTLSWMNLANVYIIFAYFDDAERFRGRLAKQKLNNEIIKSQIERLSICHSSAIHWNRIQFGDNFKKIFKQAVHAYEKMSKKNKIEIHPRASKAEYFRQIRDELRKYEGISIDGLKKPDISKDRRLHENRYTESSKSTFYLIDGLGGIYYLTAKDVWRLRDIFIIQETRFSNNRFLPSLARIQDGLFRLIFFGNIDILYQNGHQVKFQPRLSLFGNKIKGTLYLPCSNREFDVFTRKNRNLISGDEMETLRKLRVEVEKNQSFVIEIGQKHGGLP